MNIEKHPTRTTKNQPGMGWIKDRPDSRDYTPEHPKVKARFEEMKAQALPISVDLRSYCSPVQDQGNLGSCTANAAASDVEFIENKTQIGSYKDASRLFIYYATRHAIENTSGDNGAEIRDTIKELIQYGACLESTWPYVESKYDTKPSDAAYSEALGYQTLTYVSLSALNDIKTSLSNGYPVQFGFMVFDSFENIGSNGIMPVPNTTKESYLGGHAVLAVGYKTINGVEYFIIQNSWGSSWGDKGFFYMPTSLLSKKYQGYYIVDDCWAVLTEETGNSGDVSDFPMVDQAVSQIKLALASTTVTNKKKYEKLAYYYLTGNNP